MAFLEWRRFSFFDVHNNVDNGTIAECLQDTNVSVSTSGNSHVVLCDLTGWAHLISRSWEIKSFKAYELTITLAQQFQHDPYLVTVGDDEAGTNPLIKVWDWSRSDRHGSPVCVRVSRAVPSHLRPTPATALALHDNKNLMALGFQDGSVSLFRGDVTRQRSGKMKTLQDTGTSPITGLAFKGADTLFIVSRSSVMVYYLGSDRCVVLDSRGAAPGCSALADTRQLMLAAKEAVFCYTTEGRGPCYAIAGEKVRLDWFRTYLVITTNETPISTDASTSTAQNPKSHHITILDIQNKFIVFSKTFDELDAVITEWGSFYILTKNKEMIYLDEKDLQSKLSLLFKKNLYDVAIRIASSQHYDAESLTEIYKQYGDHLYAKGDLKGAIDQYIKTIGWLETSYVICKYLESRQMEPLIHYLEALHKQGVATEEHTTLLLTCRVKLDQHDSGGELRSLLSGGAALDLDVDVAIKVVRQVSPDDALTLAATHKNHDWYLKILLEDKKDFVAAVEYISELDFENAEANVRRHGFTLLQNASQETTELLKRLCTDYKPRSAPLVDESSLTGQISTPARALPDDFIHLYVNDSPRLVELLEHVLSCNVECSELVYNALLEHYLCVWSKEQSDSMKSEFESKAMKLLRDPEAKYDKDQVLLVCQRVGFRPGVLHLYEESKLWRAQVAEHMRAGESSLALALCARRGSQCPRLWLDVLCWPPPRELVPTLLKNIGSENLLSPILVIDTLASSPDYTLGDVRKYLMDVLKSESDVISRECELADKYRSETDAMKEQIESIQHSPVTFQSSRCAACARPLELPARHFLCQHAYHQHCFESYAESERECPACAVPSQRTPAAAASADSLHGRVHKEHDVYAVVSEYLGRGLFNKITLVAEGDPPAVTAAPAPTPTPAAPLQNYGPGAEARLRLQEGDSKQVYVPGTSKQTKGTTVIPIPEGRMRLLEQQQYSSSLEANLTRLPEVHKSPIPTKKLDVISATSNQISNALSNPRSNPFEEDYDESKNPFAEDDDPMNPFAEDGDDYDKNLNPFS